MLVNRGAAWRRPLSVSPRIMLAPTERRRGRAALSAPEQATHCWNRHREERSDAAIQEPQGALRPLDCFAPPAMTIAVRPKCNLVQALLT
jgi:hypothetical protein